MSNNVKDINKQKKKHTYTLFDDIIKIKNYGPNNIKIDEKSKKYKKHLKYVKINSVNPLYLMLNNMKGYFEEINENKYLTIVPTDESKEKIKV